MTMKTKEIVFKKNLQFGLFLGVDGEEYMFKYETEKDSGLGTLSKYPEGKEYEIVDDKYDDIENITSVTIKLE